MKQRIVMIGTIKRTMPKGVDKNGKPNPGNVLINAGSNEVWVNGKVWDNLLIQSELGTTAPITSYIGGSIKFDELVITPEMLTAGKGSHTMKVGNNDVTFTRAGRFPQNVELLWEDVKFDDRRAGMVKERIMTQEHEAKMGTYTAAATTTKQSTGTRPTPTETDEFVDDNETIKTGTEPKPAQSGEIGIKTLTEAKLEKAGEELKEEPAAGVGG